MGDASSQDDFGARAFVALQYVLPQHTISALVHSLTRMRARWFKNLLIRAFVKGYTPDLSDAVHADPLAYESFNAFFTRALREGARPIDAAPAAIISPVDGTVSECGPIEGDRIVQAKGHDYSLGALLAGRDELAARYRGGRFATIYLAPYNYHRIHMPLPGVLQSAWFVPGALFSVNATTTANVAGLFARNERVICQFDGVGGSPPFALVMVGALNVGSMDTVWHGEVAPRRDRVVTELGASAQQSPLTLAKGDEMGRFNMGSTVIVLLPPGAAEWSPGLRAGTTLRLGERIGELARS